VTEVDAAGARLRSILEATAGYALGRLPPGEGPVSFPGRPDDVIRPPAAVALGLAAAASTGVLPAARPAAVRLATSLAAAHASSVAGGWGYGWQTPLWAAYAGLAAWLVWDDVPEAGRAQIEAMVAREADHVVISAIPYYKNRRGVVLSPGDTKAEESSWRARVVHLACAMFPAHPQAGVWVDRGMRLLISSYARPHDTVSDNVLHGRIVREWIDGSNIEDSGILVNHGHRQPDYMVTPHHAAAAIHARLAGQPVWRAALHNLDVVYAALADVFHRPDGSLAYPPGAATWGTGRRVHLLLNDVQARVLGFGWLAARSAASWEEVHAEAVLAQIARSDDGRVYVSEDEFRSSQREEEALERAGQAYLVHVLGSPDRTNDPPGIVVSRNLTWG
jgi:hypothetical protein